MMVATIENKEIKHMDQLDLFQTVINIEDRPVGTVAEFAAKCAAGDRDARIPKSKPENAPYWAIEQGWDTAGNCVNCGEAGRCKCDHVPKNDHPFHVGRWVQIQKHPDDPAARQNQEPLRGQVVYADPVGLSQKEDGLYRLDIMVSADEWNKYFGHKTDRREIRQAYSNEVALIDKPDDLEALI